MERFGTALFGIVVGEILAVISIAWNMVASGERTLAPIKDEYANEILYYVDTETNNKYEKINEIFYYKGE